MFRLLVVALLLPAASSVMKGVQIRNHRAMCTKANGESIPLAGMSIWLQEDKTELKEWVTDSDGYIRDNTLEINGNNKFNDFTRLMYHVRCDKYGPLCPVVATACKDKGMLDKSKLYAVLDFIYNIPNYKDVHQEKYLDGMFFNLAAPGRVPHEFSSYKGPIENATSDQMTTSGILERQISIPNHRLLCRKADGSEVPLANQFIELHEDNEQLYEWETDSEGFIRDNTSVHHNRAKFLGRNSKTSLQYYVKCATYGPICPGVKETCANPDNLSPSGEWVVLPFITSLPNPEGQKMLNGWWSSIGLPYANWPYAIHHGKQAVYKRSARAMRKMLQ